MRGKRSNVAGHLNTSDNCELIQQLALPPNLSAVMTKGTTALLAPNASALSRVQALLALLASLIFKPDAAQQIGAVFAEAEAALARYMLAVALQLSGRSDLDPEMFDVKLVWRGACLDFEIQRKPDAIHPWHRIIIANFRARIVSLARLRRRLRHNRSRHYHVRLTQGVRRQVRQITARHAAHRRHTLHTPSRIAAPP